MRDNGQLWKRWRAELISRTSVRLQIVYSSIFQLNDFEIQKMIINGVLLPVAASNCLSSIVTACAASVATLAANIVPSCLPSDSPSQAALLHVQMLVEADSSY
jgi:hypothetical protein